jgi:dTMP kinase
MAAKVIEFEGIDGSGKTTAYTYFINQLRERGLKVLDTREVGSPHIPVCVALRKLILDPASKMDGKAMEFCFAAMRVENQKFYESVKDGYDYIVSDRGWLSHLAYTDHNVSAEFTKEFYVNVVDKHTKKPDLVVFLQLDPEVALKRRGLRNGFVDAIEAKGPAFQEKVYNSFMKYAKEGSLKLALIDAEEDIAGVQEQLRQLVDYVTGKLEVK